MQREKGWLATSRPLAGAASQGQATCRGGRPRPKPLVGVASPQGATTNRCSRQKPRPPAGMAGACRGGACGRRHHPRLGHKGWLPVAMLQGVIALASNC
ncbi:hypothetical protein B296_00041223 [Ensete ventricosum]|uniref:Uncharacterized protein n=1 Tax=Ensete ventricosum TaxID=4639 RepID=A0A426XCJ1_ENSVE|nr:hypothetical protein B296_00041223 [Ensete ventricosum]